MSLLIYMKKLILIFLLSIIFVSSKAQLEQGAFTIGLKYGRLHFEDNPDINTYGVDMQYFLTDYISLNSNFNFGKGFFHMPILTYIFADVIMSDFSDVDEYDWYSLIFFTEGVSFHLNINDNFTISPYINPLGLEYIYFPQGSDAYKFESTNNMSIAFTSGIRFNAVLDDYIMLSPYVEYKKLWFSDVSGYAIGMTAGFCLN